MIVAVRDDFSTTSLGTFIYNINIPIGSLFRKINIALCNIAGF